MRRREFLARSVRAGLSVGTAGALWGCVTRRESPPVGERAAPAGGPLEAELRIFNWSDYIGANTVADFSREFRVRVVYDTYESNEEMVAKLVGGASGYDIVAPSGYLVPVLVEGGLLQPLDHQSLPDWGNLLPTFVQAASDPGGRYSMPYQWGMTGLAYRSDLAATPESWSVFSDRALRGRMTMLDDGREVLGAMLRWRGHSLNSTDPDQLSHARDDALSIKPDLRAYLSATVKGQLVSGDIAVAQLWNGDARQATMEEPRVQFSVPREGSLLFLDYFAVTRNAPHRRAAHAFLNYVLRPDVAAAIAQQTGYGPANAAAISRMTNPVEPPSAAMLQRLELQRDVGAATDLWDRLWTEVKAG